MQKIEHSVRSLVQSLDRNVLILKPQISRLHRRNHTVVKLLPKLRENKILVEIPPWKRELNTTFRCISIGVSRNKAYLFQLAHHILVVIKLQGCRQALTGLPDICKWPVDAELDEKNSKCEDSSVRDEIAEVIRDWLLRTCWR